MVRSKLDSLRSKLSRSRSQSRRNSRRSTTNSITPLHLGIRSNGDMPSANGRRSSVFPSKPTERLNRWWHVFTKYGSPSNVPPEVRDTLAWWLTYAALGCGIMAYISVSMSAVFHAMQHPFITTKLTHHAFPVPGVFVCGHCLSADDPESCGVPACVIATDNPSSLMDKHNQCTSSITTSLSDADDDYDAYPQFVKDSIGHGEAGDCLRLSALPGRAFRESEEEPEKLRLRIEYPQHVLENYRTEGNRPDAVRFGVFDGTTDGNTLTAEHAQVVTGVVHVRIKRTHTSNARKDFGYTLSTDHYAVSDASSRYLSFEVEPSSFMLTDEVENMTHTWSQLLGNVSAALGLARVIAQFLLGKAALTPWGFLQRWVVRTSPSRLGRKAGLDVPSDANPLSTHTQRRALRAEIIESRLGSPHAANPDVILPNYRSSPVIGTKSPVCLSPKQSLSRGSVDEEMAANMTSLEYMPRLNMPGPKMSGATGHHAHFEAPTPPQVQVPIPTPSPASFGSSGPISPTTTMRRDAFARGATLPLHSATAMRGWGSPPPYVMGTPLGTATLHSLSSSSGGSGGQSGAHPLLLQSTAFRNCSSMERHVPHLHSSQSHPQLAPSAQTNTQTHTQTQLIPPPPPQYVLDLQFLMRRVAALESTLGKYYAADLETAIDVEMFEASKVGPASCNTF